MKPNLIKEMQQRARLTDYQLGIVRQYLEWSYGIGFDEGRVIGHGKATRVQQIKDGKVINIFDSITDAAREVHGSRFGVKASILGKREHHKGFKFKIVKESA